MDWISQLIIHRSTYGRFTSPIRKRKLPTRVNTGCARSESRKEEVNKKHKTLRSIIMCSEWDLYNSDCYKYSRYLQIAKKCCHRQTVNLFWFLTELHTLHLKQAK